MWQPLAFFLHPIFALSLLFFHMSLLSKVICFQIPKYLGKGNASFKSGTNEVPKIAGNGKEQMLSEM